jgi:hypothetical protein
MVSEPRIFYSLSVDVKGHESLMNGRFRLADVGESLAKSAHFERCSSFMIKMRLSAQIA